MAAKSKPSFEKAIGDLEKIVKDLESGDLPLEKALQRFEDGMKLSQYCNQTLDAAEKTGHPTHGRCRRRPRGHSF